MRTTPTKMSGLFWANFLARALGNKGRIRAFRIGLPRWKTIGRTIIDISGRGCFTLNGAGQRLDVKGEENYTLKYLEHFMESFVHSLGATVHADRVETRSTQESGNGKIKSFGLALDQATQVDPRRKGNGAFNLRGLLIRNRPE